MRASTLILAGGRLTYYGTEYKIRRRGLDMRSSGIRKLRASVKARVDDASLGPLPEPRPLREDERRVLDFVVRAPAAAPELRAQAASAVVTAECSCGCGSIALRTDGPPAPDAAVSELLEARARNVEGDKAQVNLHVFGGVMHELEIWCWHRGVKTAPLDPSTLEYVR